MQVRLQKKKKENCKYDLFNTCSRLVEVNLCKKFKTHLVFMLIAVPLVSECFVTNGAPELLICIKTFNMIL